MSSALLLPGQGPSMPSSFASNVGMFTATPVGFSGVMPPTTSSSAPILPQVSARSIPASLVPPNVKPVRLGSFEDSSSALSTARELTTITSTPARAVSPYRPPPVEVSSSASFKEIASPRTRLTARAISPARALRELPNTFSEIISQAPLAYGGSLKPQPQLNPVPQKFEDVSMGSPQFHSGRGESDRRPADPFFYPTTLVPLTRFGLNAIDSTTPPKMETFAPPRETSVGFGGTLDETIGFVKPPLRSFVEQPEEMRVLQEQNDSLERQIQALEHAKSLAAVQSAQALQKLRARQEQLRREAQQAFQRSKEMQVDLALPSFEPCTAPSTESLKTTVAAPQEGSLFERPQWNEEAWREMSQQSSSQTLRGSPNDLRGVVTHERAGSSLNIQQSPSVEQTLPAFDVPPNDTSGMANRILTAHGTPCTGNGPGVQSTHISTDMLAVTAPYVDALGNPLGPATISELPNIKDDPPVIDIQSYERQTGSSLNVNTLSALVQQAPVLPAGHAIVQQTSTSQVPLGQEVVVTTPRAYEGSSASESHTGSVNDLLARPLPTGTANAEEVYQGVTHERAALSSRQAGTDSARLGIVGDTVSRQQQQQYQQRTNDGTGDEAAGSAIPAPPPLEVSTGSSKNDTPVNRTPQTSQRPPRRESGATSGSRGNSGRRRIDEEAPQRARRDRSNSKPPIPARDRAANQRASDASDLVDVSSNQIRNLPPDASEELQAELEECLDMIRWCSATVTRESLQDLKNTSQPPPPVVHHVLEAVSLLLLGQPDTRWDKLKKMLASPTFLDRIQRLNFQQNTTRDQFRQLRDYLQRPLFNEEHIKQVCVPVVPLAMWCRCIGVYLSKVKFRGGPEIRPVAAAGGDFPAQQQVDRRPAPSEDYMQFDPDLSQMTTEELRCVKDLTIARPEVGTITFHGTTDCSDLDFRTIVRLEIGEVLVYPNSDVKPPVGVGLNKPAIVTMYQCWPPNGRRLLQDQRSQEKYKMKIKKMTEEKHATFLDYDCMTGVWKFSVEHF